MRLIRGIATCCAPLLVCAVFASQGSHSPRAELRTLTTASQAHDISLEEAARNYPVRLRGVVTFYDPNIDSRHAALFVHDATGSIFIGLPPRPILALKPGTLVEVTGTTGNGDYAPVILHGAVKILGESHLPQNASHPTMAELLSGSEDGKWVEVEGVVHAVRLQPSNVTVEIATVGGSITATAPREPNANYDSLVDATVQLRGNAVPLFNGFRQMVGARILFPSLHELRVVQPAPRDPYAVPPVPVAQLLWFTPGVVLRHRAHIRGTVTLHWPGRMLCIQQSSSGLCMPNPNLDQVQTGQMVDVVGFPGVSDLKPALENASFRVVQANESIAPASATIQRAFHGEFDRQLVQMDGELIGQDRATGDLTLMLRSGEFLFSAILPKGSGSFEMLPWREGSLIRITGICSVRLDPTTTGQGSGSVQTGSVSILLRSLDDVKVLHSPSWWTSGHALAVLSFVGAGIFVAIAWIVVLKRRVQEQTKAIRLSEERLRHLSQHDALTGLPNRFLLNDRLDVALKRLNRFDAALGLLMVDLDGFKEVNDSLGHHAGDLVLCEVAARLVRSVRQTDTVARLGGDEFIVLVPDLHRPDEAENIAAKIVASIAEPIDIESKVVFISVSVGVCGSPENASDAENLLRCADAAMYQAKASGKNGYRVYRDSTQAKLISQ